MTERCPWCGDDPLYVAYHDTEWGVPEYGSRALWEKLVLDGFQAGLAWITILRKRDAFRDAFAGFDPSRVARFDESDEERLLADSGIVRHGGKIRAAIKGAQIWEAIEEREGFDSFLWRYTDGKPIRNSFSSMAEVPAQTPLSQRISKDLKAEGFTFVGPTIIYAFMQAVGMVNDHLTGCFRYTEVNRQLPASSRSSPGARRK